MSKFTISIFLIFTVLVANAIYIINQDIDTNKEKAKQRERILDFEMSPKFQINKSTTKDIEYIKDYYFTENLKS